MTSATHPLVMLVTVSVCRLACGLGVVKALSALLGPAQFGVISQIVGSSSVVYSLAGGGIGNGLILYEGRERQKGTHGLWLAAALNISLISSMMLGIVALALYWVKPQIILAGSVPATIFLAIAIIQIIIGVGNVLLAYASATHDLKSFSSANILGSISWLLCIVLLTVFGGFDGAVWAVIITPAFTAIAIIAILWTPFRIALAHLLHVEWTRTEKLLRASALTALAVCALPLAHTIVRADLAIQASWRDVGLWQAVMRLSDAYMQIFGVIAINLLLPRLLQSRDLKARRDEVRRTGGAMLLLFAAGSAFLYYFREPVLQLAYSTEFAPAGPLIAPQLCADFAKVCSWIIVYRFIAAGYLWVQPAAETLQAVGLVGFYFLLLPAHGVTAPVLGHLASSIVLLIVLTVLVTRLRV